MLHTVKKVFKNIKSPEYIVFNNMVRVNFTKVPENIKHNITFFENDVKKTMDYTDITRLFEKYKRTNEIIDYKNYADNYSENIENSLKIYPNDIQDILMKDVNYLTYFSRYFEDYNMTNLMRKYQVEPYEIFCFLVQPFDKFENTKEFNNTFQKNLDFYSDEFLKIKNEHDKQDNYVYFDYYNYVRLKCRIPKKINSPVTINIRRYANYNNFYSRLFNMIVYKANKNPNLLDNKNYDIFEENHNDYDNKDTIVNNSIFKDSKINIEKFNKEIKKTIVIPKKDHFQSHEYWIYDSVINKKSQSWFNHRNDNLGKNKLWDYMMDKYYHKYVKNNLENYELANYLEVNSNNKLKFKSYDFNLDSISIVNLIIFGKTNINQNILERIMPLIRFNENKQSESIQLDNYVIVKNHFQINNYSYEIHFDDNIDELKFVNSDSDKRKIVRSLLKLMNEVNPEYLNFNNYYQLSLWEYLNDSFVQVLNNNCDSINSSRNSYNKLYKNLEELAINSDKP